mmetsp:Transcript_18310/g.27431  ORF Transcript_18310/g.27431 Transcript_18310/m.27431 type:complete len:206 (+) Transcript_18310:50-667(+)
MVHLMKIFLPIILMAEACVLTKKVVEPYRVSVSGGIVYDGDCNVVTYKNKKGETKPKPCPIYSTDYNMQITLKRGRFLTFSNLVCFHRTSGKLLPNSTKHRAKLQDDIQNSLKLPPDLARIITSHAWGEQNHEYCCGDVSGTIDLPKRESCTRTQRSTSTVISERSAEYYRTSRDSILLLLLPVLFLFLLLMYIKVPGEENSAPC